MRKESQDGEELTEYKKNIFTITVIAFAIIGLLTIAVMGSKKESQKEYGLFKIMAKQGSMTK